MKKLPTLPLVVALYAAFGSTGAMAQAASNMTISGVVDAYVGTRQLAGGVSQTKVDSSGMTTSQVNFSGTEDLGGGNRAEFALGMFFRPDDGGLGRFVGDTYFGRSSYVGLGGNWGTLRLGRQTTGNFLNFIRTNSFGDSAVFGPAFVHTWIAAIGQGTQFLSGGAPVNNRALTGALGTSDTAWNNAVGYVSPSLGGTVFQAQWAPGEASGVGSRLGASAFYSNGPLTLGLATEQIGANSVPASGPAAAAINHQATWNLSGAYAFGFGRVSTGLINTQRDYTVVTDDRVRTVHLGVTIPVGAGTVMAQVANSRQQPDVGTEMTRTTTSVGYSYAFSKRTDVYAVLMNDRFTGQADGNSVGLGLRHRF
ncbi:MAG TPA: porin [Rhodoferax sp.]